MRALPRSRAGRVVAVVVVAVLLVGAFLARDTLWFAAKLAVPAPAYSAAADRTSPPAPFGAAVPLPAPRPATRPTGQDPSVTLGPRLALDEPSALAMTGDGTVLVTTLDGRVHAVDLDGGEAEVVLDVRHLVSTGGERGLLGIAVDPDGERLYLDLTDPGGDTDIRSWALRDGRPDASDRDGVLHLEIGQPFPNHNGGHLAFGPDGALWIGTGDGGGAGDRGGVAQDDGSLLGKLLRVLPAGGEGGFVAPRSNPGWDRPEVWAIGLRNPWRWSFDRHTQRLWIADVGQNAIEEVSVLDPDAPAPNLGWNLLEGENRYEGDADPALTDPVVTYGHDEGCSVTGGYVYRGDDVPGLHGWYVFGDYCGGWIRAVPADDPTSEPVELAADVGSVISFGELDDGELVVLAADGIRRLLPPA